VIVATAPESHYVLDGILGNQTDLPVTEHATDTHGATLANFALFDLVGLQLSPRIRDLGHHDEQTEQMWCLTLATNAVVTWTTEYHGLAVTALRRAGRDVDDAMLAHIWPTHHENVHFYGTHSVDVAGELAKLDSDGYRPLRAPGSAPAGEDDR
jgi:TnpA family transposase